MFFIISIFPFLFCANRNHSRGRFNRFLFCIYAQHCHHRFSVVLNSCAWINFFFIHFFLFGGRLNETLFFSVIRFEIIINSFSTILLKQEKKNKGTQFELNDESFVLVASQVLSNDLLVAKLQTNRNIITSIFNGIVIGVCKCESLNAHLIQLNTFT